MSSSAPASLSRYRPAVLVLTGAAAAYATYLVYNSFQSSPADGLHRSNAIRRPNARARARTARGRQSLEQSLENNAHALGGYDFFGSSIHFDPRQLPSRSELRETAHESQPTASPELVEHAIRELYDTFLDRLLVSNFRSRTLTSEEADAVSRWMLPRMDDAEALPRALQRHEDHIASAEADAPGGAIPAPDTDGAESIAATHLSWRSDEDTDGGALDSDGQVLQRTLYHIAEDRARQEGVIHRGITCNGCDEKPIRGIRWRCANCADFDLCSNCEATNSHHKTHIFYKIRVPAPYLSLPKQEPVYPGRPHMMPPSVPFALKKRLVSETKMETEEIEALWDQFTCLAGSDWDSDPNGIGVALDRRAFNHAFVPRYATFVTAPNLIYDRVFAYYDSDHNGRIGFEEFIKGLDGLHSSDPKVKLRIMFNGYDVDGDGFISRKDVLRIFRAYYAIEREATRNYLAETAEELSVRGALETIHSSQPLGSAFTQEIPHYGIPENVPDDKLSDLGTLDPVVRDDESDLAEREEVLGATNGLFGAEHRWIRRQYYVDEEEGLHRPENLDLPLGQYISTTTDQMSEEPTTPENERPRWSRSSSRVRFQDDVEVETRSNASTSSRPVGERWGGYEIPEPEKDLGKEVLYQITQQAFNELLDPLFKEKEDMAMDAFGSRGERRKCASEIEETIRIFEEERELNGLIFVCGCHQYLTIVIDHIVNQKSGNKAMLECLQRGDGGQDTIEQWAVTTFTAVNQDFSFSTKGSDQMNQKPDDTDLWSAHFFRIRLREELVQVITTLARRLGWLAPLTPAHIVGEEVYRDPTMPQFRPNSLADSASNTSSTSSSSQQADPISPFPGSDDSSAIDVLSFVPIWIQPPRDNPEGDEKSTGDANPNPPPSPTSTDGDGFLTVTVQLDDSTQSQQAQENQNHQQQQQQQHQPEDHYESPPSPQPQIQSMAPKTVPSTTISPIFQAHRLHLDPRALSLTIQSCPRNHTFTPNPNCFVKAILARDSRRRDASTHIAWLASLEAAEREDNRRKGSGLLDFQEFEAKMRDERLRFLEGWMDWVSY